jgi:hypothetical protein
MSSHPNRLFTCDKWHIYATCDKWHIYANGQVFIHNYSLHDGQFVEIVCFNVNVTCIKKRSDLQSNKFYFKIHLRQIFSEKSGVGTR